MSAINFDTPINREGTWAEKYDARQALFGRADVQPLWVADMDFATPDFVLDAMRERLAHPVLGYTQVPLSVAEVVCDWQKSQHGWLTYADDIVWLGGVVSGLYLSVQAFTEPTDGVMVFTPVYPPFMKAVTDCNRQLVRVPLVNDGIRYQLDFDAIETAIGEYKVKLLLLSNPHNPSGRVWTQAELTQLASLCLRHGVTVVSDEVWSDILLNQSMKHVPFAHLSPEVAAQTITLNAPSKTFNLAAMHTAYAIISNPILRVAFVQRQAKTRASEASLLGLHALQAAYSDDGKRWLADLLNYLRLNLALARSQLDNTAIGLMIPDASYLLWLNCSQSFQTQAELVQWCVHDRGLGMSSGTHFGEEGKGFMRLNMAIPQTALRQALTVLTEK
jgi:cystathionine beta-lyase